MPKLVRLGISMPSALAKHARLAALAHGYSVSQVIRHLLRLFIADPSIMETEASDPDELVTSTDLQALHDKLSETLERR